MMYIAGRSYDDDSWWGVRQLEPELATARSMIVEVQYMSQSKLFALHVEDDSAEGLITRAEVALAQLKARGGGSAPAPEGKPAKGGKGESKPDASAPKVTLDGVKQALIKLREAVGGKDDGEKKGLKAVKAVLKKFGVTQSPDLKEDQYPGIMKAISEAMPSEESDGEDF